jgi:hypothetical protein
MILISKCQAPGEGEITTCHKCIWHGYSACEASAVLIVPSPLYWIWNLEEKKKKIQQA